MTVCKLNQVNHTHTELYNCIETMEEAELLAQLAMLDKRDDELIFIFPGWNRGINKNQQEYERALQLAEEYKADVDKVFN